MAKVLAIWHDDRMSSVMGSLSRTLRTHSIIWRGGKDPSGLRLIQASRILTPCILMKKLWIYFLRNKSVTSSMSRNLDKAATPFLIFWWSFRSASFIFCISLTVDFWFSSSRILAESTFCVYLPIFLGYLLRSLFSKLILAVSMLAKELPWSPTSYLISYLMSLFFL